MKNFTKRTWVTLVYAILSSVSKTQTGISKWNMFDLLVEDMWETKTLYWTDHSRGYSRRVWMGGGEEKGVGNHLWSWGQGWLWVGLEDTPLGTPPPLPPPPSFLYHNSWMCSRTCVMSEGWWMEILTEQIVFYTMWKLCVLSKKRILVYCEIHGEPKLYMNVFKHATIMWNECYKQTEKFEL